MRVVGVVAEYNPFHRGHAYHLAEAKRLAKADAVAVVMSSVFTQRGDAALLPPAVRARMALENGADAVFALPACWSVRDAEHFALGSVSLLHGLGVDALSFGAETADLHLLTDCATLLEDPDDAFTQALRRYLNAGLSHPAALSAAASEISPDMGAVLGTPNNTLSVCYLRALLRLHASMDIYPVIRTADYHDTALDAMQLPSATALRGAIARGDWRGASAAMPESAYALLRKTALTGQLQPKAGLDAALLYRLRTMTDADWAALPGLSEGIGDRLRAVCGQASSRDALIAAAKVKRYPYARLSRLCTHALLHITANQLEETPLPPAAWLLGFRKDKAGLLSRLSVGGMPIIGKAADYERSAPWFRTELLAYDLWCIGAGMPAGLAFTQGVAVR